MLSLGNNTYLKTDRKEKCVWLGKTDCENVCIGLLSSILLKKGKLDLRY